jgi:hypothetical protein
MPSLAPWRFLRQELQTIDGKCAFDARKIKVVGAKNLEIAQLIAQAELVVRLQLVAMAGATDTLKVFPAVWIANP